MASALRACRGLRALCRSRFRGSGSTSIRGSSSATACSQQQIVQDPNYCYILGLDGQPRPYPISRFIEFDAFIQKNSFLESVPDDRLIDYVDPVRPYFTSSTGKKIVRTGLMLLYVCDDLGLSVIGAFQEGNVGVIEGLDTVAFCKLDIRPSVSGSGGSTQDVVSPGTEEATYGAFIGFLKRRAKKVYGTWSEEVLPPGLQDLFKSLDGSTRVNSNLTIYNPELFPLELTHTMYMETHRLLRKQMPIRGQTLKAYAITCDIDKSISSRTGDARTIASQDLFLRHGMGISRAQFRRTLEAALVAHQL